jgi:DNA topoisomerase-1
MKLVIPEKEKMAVNIASALGRYTADYVKSGGASIRVYKVGDHIIMPLSGHVMNFTTIDSLSKWTQNSITAILSNPGSLQKVATSPAHIQAIKQLASISSEVILALDADEEGENIGLEVVETLRSIKYGKPVRRLWLSTTVPADIKAAFSNLRQFNENLALSVEARRKLDATVGFAGTRELTIDYKHLFGSGVISYGRVQTATLRLVVERELAIKGFQRAKRWVVEAKVLNTIFHNVGKPFEDKQKAQALYNSVKDLKEFHCKGVKSTTSQMLPPTPMNTTALLKAGSGIIRYTPNEVLSLAEALYLDAAITYPRVDNQAYSQTFDHAANLKQLKGSKFASNIDYILSKRTILGKPIFTQGKAASDHEPITPIRGIVGYKDAKAEAVYDLVLRHYLSIFYPPAKFADINVDGTISQQGFTADGRRLTEKGFYDIFYYQPKLKAIDDFTTGKTYPVEWVKLVERQTEPPARFTESSLIAEMDRIGIGTKATRPNIIEVIKNRNYVTRSPGGVLTPTDRGMKLIELLAKVWPQYTSAEFTARVEKEMDEIAQGKRKWTDVVNSERNAFLAAVNTIRNKRAATGTPTQAGAQP